MNDQLADLVVKAISVRIERTLAPLISRLEALERKDGLSSEDIRALIDKAVGPVVSTAVAAIPVPKNGEPGKDVDAVQVATMIQTEVTKQVAALPKAEPGKDADPEVVRELVRKAIADLPTPKDGESIDVGTLMTSIHTAAAQAVQALGKPKDGTSVDREDVAAMIAVEVQRQVGQLPAAKAGEPGKSVTVDEVRPVIEAEVAAAVKSIRVPEDGKSVDLTEVKAMVEAAVALIPTPKNGDSVTVEDVRPMLAEMVAGIEVPVPDVTGPVKEAVSKAVSETVRDEVARADVPGLVARAVAAIPAPEPGKPGESVHPDTVRLMVQEAVTKAVQELPDPEPGKDADPAVMAQSVHEEVQRQFDALRPLIKGEPGDPGAGIESMDMDLGADGRTLTFRFVGANFEKKVEVVAPWQIYQGVYKSGIAYKQGDVVSYAGSMFVAKTDTSGKPETEDGGWQMCVKRGKDA
jgi:hypothetical protein